jgi:hypothetical protein
MNLIRDVVSENARSTVGQMAVELKRRRMNPQVPDFDGLGEVERNVSYATRSFILNGI